MGDLTGRSFMSIPLTEEPLLLTAAITPGAVPFVAVADGQERAIQYFCAVISWLRLSGAKNIVLCENTSTEVDFAVLVDLARSLGKDLEVLKFSGNVEAQRYGKGYGEGKIIEYAVDHSRLLGAATSFYKATGRLFLPGFDAVAASTRDRNQLFIEDFYKLETRLKKYMARGILRAGSALRNHPSLANQFAHVRPRINHALNLPVWVNTRFFKCDIGFYKQHLKQVYTRADDANGYFLENVFFDALKGFPQAKVWHMPLNWVGVSGTLGTVVYGDSDYSAAMRAEAETLFRRGNPTLARP
jgi:hypothetical protein